MYIEKTNEWWKLKIYQYVTEYLKNPNDINQGRLNTALYAYSDFYAKHNPSSNSSSYDDYEELISA